MLVWSSVVVVQLDNIEACANMVGAAVLIDEDVVVASATFPRHIHIIVRDLERTGRSRRLRDSFQDLQSKTRSDLGTVNLTQEDSATFENTIP